MEYPKIKLMSLNVLIILRFFLFFTTMSTVTVMITMMIMITTMATATTTPTIIPLGSIIRGRSAKSVSISN